MLSNKERVAGCLFTGALGDAIGAQFENQQRPEFFVPDTLYVTDDTQLTIATCESIILKGIVDPESIASRFALWYQDRRISGIGSSTLKSLIELDAGGHWALVGATGERSAGNGAAMRISPLAFFLDPNDFKQRRTICDICRITHRNDEAYIGALAVIYAMNCSRLDRELLQLLITKLPDSQVRDRFMEIQGDKLSFVQLVAKYPTSGFVVDSVPAAILAALECKNLMDSIQSIVESGGDTDSVASMFGNIFGAVNGTQWLPLEIVKRIDLYGMIESIVTKLSQLTN